MQGKWSTTTEGATRLAVARTALTRAILVAPITVGVPWLYGIAKSLTFHVRVQLRLTKSEIGLEPLFSRA